MCHEWATGLGEAVVVGLDVSHYHAHASFLFAAAFVGTRVAQNGFATTLGDMSQSEWDDQVGALIVKKTKPPLTMGDLTTSTWTEIGTMALGAW